MFKICDEPGSPNEGGVFKIYDELVSRNLVNRGVFKIYDEQESPHEGTCQVFKMYDELVSFKGERV